MNSDRLRRWLIASALLNVFLVCGIAGGAWRWWTVERLAAQAATPVPVQPRGLRYAAEQLSPERRQAYRASLREARSDVAAAIAIARDSRREVMRELVAPEFDRAAAAAALARAREADLVQRARYEAAVIAFAATLPVEERLTFAAGLAQRSNLAPRRPPQESQ